jgi:hypothetical protein
MVCPKSNSHVYKLKKVAIGEHIYFYFATWGPKRYFYGRRSAQCLKKVVIGQSMCLLSNKKSKKKCGCTHELINIPPTRTKGRPVHSMT